MRGLIYNIFENINNNNILIRTNQKILTTHYLPLRLRFLALYHHIIVLGEANTGGVHEINSRSSYFRWFEFMVWYNLNGRSRQLIFILSISLHRTVKSKRTVALSHPSHGDYV